jgi:uncharacterized protein YkwD
MKGLTLCGAAMLLLMGCVGVSATDRSTAALAAQTRCDLPNFNAVVLARLNAARGAGADCGKAGRFAPAAALRWSTQLTIAADSHSQDMATAGDLSHTSSDGRTLRERINAAGYAWSAIGENIAAGEPTVSRAMDGWLASPAHCANIMNPAFKDVGAACVVAAPGARYASYWTMKFGAPR